jgi:NADH-quinone oxidoreductase subunit M
VGEFLILLGAFKVVPVITIIATASLILAGVYSLIMIHRALFGQPKSQDKLADLSGRELSLIVSLVGILLFLGLYPQPVLNVSQGAMARIEHIYAPVSTSSVIAPVTTLAP